MTKSDDVLTNKIATCFVKHQVKSMLLDLSRSVLKLK